MGKGKMIVLLLVLLTIIIGTFFINVKKTDYNCDDFKTQYKAQQKFNQFYFDKYHLDKDKDGIACESLP